MKKIKWSSIIIAICYIVAGIMFFANAQLTKEIICSWMGYGLIIVGAIDVISYLIRPKQETFLKDDFCDGLILITIGILPLSQKELVISFVFLGLAVIIMISGYKKLQDGVDSWRLGEKNILLYLVLAAISIVIGLIIILDTTLSEKTLHYLIGGGLLYSGISDLISSIFLSSKIAEFGKEPKKKEAPKEEILDDKNNTPEV